MPTSTKRLFLGGLSVLLLCGTLDAEARKHHSDGKKPDETSAPAKPADTATGTDKAAKPADAAAAPSGSPGATPASAATPATTSPPSAGSPSAKTPPAGSTASAGASGSPSSGANKGPAGPAPAPAAAPKELETQVSGPKQEAARAHFQRGVELYTQGDFPNAWLEFNSAYQIVPLVDLLNNVARCEVRMGKSQQALEHFQRFIAARPTDQDSEYIRQEIARLEGEVGRTTTATAAPEPDKPAVAQQPRRIPIYGIMTGAATLALVIAGAATLGVTNSAYNDLQTRCSPTCFAEDVSVLQRQANAGYGLLGVAAAGALATGLVFYFELRGSKETSLRPLARLGGGSPIGLIGRF